MNDTTIVILTAMNLEYDAVRAQLSGITTHTHPMGTRFEVGQLSGCRVALALTGEGNQSAAVLAERAAAEFAPAAVIFVGVAGALRPPAPSHQGSPPAAGHAQRGPAWRRAPAGRRYVPPALLDPR